jgi:hypothetical protein
MMASPFSRSLVFTFFIEALIEKAVSMPGTLYFVHGTGVREEGFRRTRELIRAGLDHAHLVDVHVGGLCWGEKFGVKFGEKELEALLPRAISKSLSGEPSDLEVESAFWDSLITDPLFELRFSTGHSHSETRVSLPLPKRRPSAQDAVAMLVAVRGRLSDPLVGEISAREIAEAVEWLSRQPIFVESAREFEKASDTVFVMAISRALVARALARRRLESAALAPAALYRRNDRDQLVSVVAKALSPASTKGAMGSWLENKAKAAAKAKAASYALSRRHGLTADSLPGVGDILFYQRRGVQILRELADDLERATPPVVAVGHSLGGIMLVDLLSRLEHPRVERLVTVGSQSPLFFTIDALETLRLKEAVRPFTPWLNIFDRNDLLSFCAERVFPGIKGIADNEVASGAPFPESHSAYWQLEDVYSMIAAFWPK